MSNLTCKTDCNTNETSEAALARPRYSTQKLDDAWEVRAIVPGVRKEDLEIAFENDVLAITAKRPELKPKSWRPVAVRSRSAEGYALNLTVNVDIDSEAISASLEDGVLVVSLPLSEAAKPRLIPVQ